MTSAAKSKEIELHSVRMIPVSGVKLDPENPNVMSDEQMDGLRESMRRFGYLDPIVVDEQGMIADGEHRLQVYKEFGQKEIPAYVLKLDEVERRLLRQTKNKLHGEHVLAKDIAEMKILYESGSIGDLARLIAVPEDTLRVLATDGAIDVWKEWNNEMPQYVSEDASGRIIRVHFPSETDVQKFAKAIGQQIRPETKFLWFPEQPKADRSRLEYASKESSEKPAA